MCYLYSPDGGNNGIPFFSDYKGIIRFAKRDSSAYLFSMEYLDSPITLHELSRKMPDTITVHISYPSQMIDRSPRLSSFPGATFILKMKGRQRRLYDQNGILLYIE